MGWGSGYRTDCKTYVDTVEEEVLPHLAYYVAEKLLTAGIEARSILSLRI